MAHTLKELSDLYAKKQPTQVDALTEEAPILNMLPFEPSSHGLWNAYEKITDVTGAAFVDMGSALPTVKADSDVLKFDLMVMGGEMECDEDKAKLFGGVSNYFAKKMPVILRKSGQSAESSIIHDTLRAFAIANSNVLEPASASGDSNYTLLCVRFTPGETTGLYSPDGFQNGALLDAMAINGGDMYKNSSGVLVYGMRLKNYFGFQVANERAVSGIVNVKSTKLFTSDQLDQVIEMARGDMGNTYIMSHPVLRRFAGSLKNSKLQVANTDSGVDNRVTEWNGIPWITSYNFANGTETDVAI